MRDRRLRPGGAQPREEAAENQRARIYGAIVACSAEHGYRGTRLEDIERLSGVSNRSFYELFADKEAAFVATLGRLLEATVQLVLSELPGDTWERAMEERLGVLAELIEEQAPAARMCLIEAYVAGPRSGALLEQAIERAEGMVSARLAESPERAAIPPEMAIAAVGAVIEVIRTRLTRASADTAEILPALLSFLLSFRAPTTPLRSAARSPAVRPEAAEASDHAERALRAFEGLLVEEALSEVTMEQVAERAGMSRRTLYANFSDRRRLLSAAIDGACAQVAAAMLPAYHRHDAPAEGLRTALGALLSLLASRPNLAHLLLIASYEGGEESLRRRRDGLRPIRSLLRAVPAAPPGSAMSSIAVEAALGGLLALMRRRLLDAGAAGLPSLGPICTYIALAPLIGAAQATIAAEGRTYRRARSDLHVAVARTEVGISAGQVPIALADGRPRSAVEIAEEAGKTPQEAEALVAQLVGLGLIEPVEASSVEEEGLYRANWPMIATEDWAQMGKPEREAASSEIARMIEIEIEDALDSGTFDSRPERHLVRIPARLDQEGWQELDRQLDLTTDRCLDIEKRARERLAAAGENAESISARIYVVSFEAAPPDEGS